MTRNIHTSKRHPSANSPALHGLSLLRSSLRHNRFHQMFFLACACLAFVNLAPGLRAAELTLLWEDNSSTESGFKIERAVGSAAFTQIATTGANVTRYTDTGLASSTTYRYRTRAYNAIGNSAYSNEAATTTAGTSPTPTPAPTPAPDPEPDPDPASNLISNGGFESGMASWTFYTNGTGSAITSGFPYEGNNAALVTTSTTGTNIQLLQSGLRLEPNTSYQLSFAAYSSTGNDLRVSLAKNGSPYTNYGINRTRADLTSTWNTFTINFTTENFSSTVSDGRLYFWFASDARPGDRFFIDKVILVKSGSTQTSTAPPPPAPAPGAASNLLTNPGFESGMASWGFYTNGSGSAITSGPPYEGNQAALITTSTGGSNIQFHQHGLQLEPNTNYQLSFAAYSSTGHDFRVSLIKHGSPYTNYGINNAQFDLTSTWQVFTLDFKTNNFGSTVNDGRLYFWFANDAQPGDRYFLDRLIMIKK